MEYSIIYRDYKTMNILKNTSEYVFIELCVRKKNRKLLESAELFCKSKCKLAGYADAIQLALKDNIKIKKKCKPF